MTVLLLLVACDTNPASDESSEDSDSIVTTYDYANVTHGGIEAGKAYEFTDRDTGVVTR